jgi:hypothetical protein
MTEASPLIVTLALDEPSFQFLNSFRQRYFPPVRNFLTAHLTLFHHLPSDEPQIWQDLNKWSEEQEPFSLRVTEVKSIGKGVVYKIECEPLLQLHRMMQKAWGFGYNRKTNKSYSRMLRFKIK